MFKEYQIWKSGISNLCREPVHSWRLMSFWVATLDLSEHRVLNYTCHLLILHAVLLTSFKCHWKLWMYTCYCPSFNIHHRPSTMDQLPCTIYHPPPSMSHHLLWTNFHLLSPATIRHLPSTDFHRPSTIRRLLSAIYHKPSTLCRLPFAISTEI